MKIEERVLAKEDDIDRKLTELIRREQGVADREVHLRQLQEDMKELKASERAELERIAGDDDRRGAGKDPRRVRGAGPPRARGPRPADGGGGRDRGEAARAQPVADALQRVAASAAAERR